MSPTAKPTDAVGMEWGDFDARLRGEHLKGKDVIVTIRAVLKETVHPPGQPERSAPVVYFEKSNKGLVLSPTNHRALAALFGPNVADCIGKKITLRAVPQQVAGRECLPIRILPAQQ